MLITSDGFHRQRKSGRNVVAWKLTGLTIIGVAFETLFDPLPVKRADFRGGFVGVCGGRRPDIS